MARSRPWRSSPTSLPSRSTTTRSAHAVTSFEAVRDEDDADAVAFRSAMTSQQPVGLGERQARRRLVHDDQARCRATAPWRSRAAGAARATARRPACRARSRRRARRRAAGRASRSRVRSTSRSGPPRSGSRPMKTLAAASRLSKRLSSWCTKAMPAAIASATVIASRSVPSTRIAAGARRDHAAEDLHQRRLAGAVLADEADHLARRHGKARRRRGRHAGIGLGDRRRSSRNGSAIALTRTAPRSGGAAFAAKGVGISRQQAIFAFRSASRTHRRWPCRSPWSAR